MRGEEGKKGKRECTSETVDGPLLELLEGDFRGRGRGVEIQPVRVFLRFVEGVGELFFLVVEDVAAFGVDAVTALADHLDLGRHTITPAVTLSLSHTLASWLGKILFANRDKEKFGIA